MNKLLLALFVLAAVAAITSARCRDSCHFRPNGDYPCNCRGCPHYFRCTRGRIQYRLCPNFGCWDPFKRLCGSGCPTGPHGVGSCVGLRDGNYQDCFSCHWYVSCSGGIYYRRPCPFPLVWDDRRKRCLWDSRTCFE
ncbi:hypothetical protein NP493_1727g00037 [Ridgeia piscesae]|uniref:Chitin-binding type-2 domain-containing protein n=1 Tax=Ridgeia piscesae TaxID=27915 RepID=A0AAD9N760_RIDPI|nr:hypothetical protein NP493_1727g00037 [Ridgeia piscesae]